MDKKQEKLMIIAAIFLAFAPLLLTGCAAMKPKPLTPKSYAQGYADGKKKARAAFVSEYGDLLRSCASKDAVRAINDRLTECRTTVENGKRFATNCLKGYKLAEKELDGCKSSLSACIFERDELNLLCGK